MSQIESYLNAKKARELKSKINVLATRQIKFFRIIKKLAEKGKKYCAKYLKTKEKLEEPPLRIQKRFIFFRNRQAEKIEEERKSALKKELEELSKVLDSNRKRLTDVAEKNEQTELSITSFFKSSITSKRSILANELLNELCFDISAIFSQVDSIKLHCRLLNNPLLQKIAGYSERVNKIANLSDDALIYIKQTAEKAEDLLDKHINFIEYLETVQKDFDEQEVIDAVKWLSKDRDAQRNKSESIKAYLERSEKIKAEMNYHQLVAVHVVDYFPKNGIMKPLSRAKEWLKTFRQEQKLEKLEYFPRETLHFCLNGMAGSHFYGNFKGRQYAIIIPAHLIRSRIFCLFGVDTFVIGDLELPKGSYVLVFEGEKTDAEKIREKYKKISGKAEIKVYPEEEIKNQEKVIAEFLAGIGYTVFSSGNRQWNSFFYADQETEFREALKIFEEEIKYKKHKPKYFSLENARGYFETTHAFGRGLSTEHENTAFKLIESYVANFGGKTVYKSIIDGTMQTRDAEIKKEEIKKLIKHFDEIHYGQKISREERKALMRLKKFLRELLTMLERYTQLAKQTT
jgi:hypothetical protein